MWRSTANFTANSFRLLQGKGFDERVDLSNFNRIIIKEDPSLSYLLNCQSSLSFNNLVHVANEININGTTYKKNFYVCVSEPCLTFFRINLIIIDEHSVIYFVCFKLENKNYNEHYEAYELGAEHKTPLIFKSYEINSPPLHVHFVTNKKLIRLKHF